VAAERGVILNSRLASDGASFLAAWDVFREGAGVHVRRIPSSGPASDAIGTVAPGRLLDLMFDGREFVFSYSTGFVRAGIAHIAAAGEVKPFETLTIGVSAEPVTEVSLAPIGYGKAIAVFARLAPEALYGGTIRVFVGTPHPARGRAAAPAD
jgi:hypothetical protein